MGSYLWRKLSTYKISFSNSLFFFKYTVAIAYKILGYYAFSKNINLSGINVKPNTVNYKLLNSWP